jgi:hypothetical protein
MKLTAFVICILANVSLNAQNVNADKALNPLSTNFKLSTYLLLNGGWGISGSFGAWQRFKRVQPSTSISVNIVCGKRNLGNKNRFNSNWQLNTIISPMITFRLNSKVGIEEELHPYYFGGANTINTNYCNSITVGSTFMTTPKGFGKNKNTFRNRSQQLVYLGLRFGGDSTNHRNIQFHIYEDFLLTDNRLLQFLADNFDRYYTGGGNIQVRFNQKLKLNFYNENYTGNFEYDLFDYPDIYQVGEPLKNLRRFVGWRKKLTWFKKSVFQEPGQKILNNSRTFAKLDYSFNNGFDQFSLIVGSNDRKNWIQNVIHDNNGTQKVSANTEYKWNRFNEIQKDSTKLSKGGILDGYHSSLSLGRGNVTEGKHYFDQVTTRNRFIIGANYFKSFITKQ